MSKIQTRDEGTVYSKNQPPLVVTVGYLSVSAFCMFHTDVPEQELGSYPLGLVKPEHSRSLVPRPSHVFQRSHKMLKHMEGLGIMVHSCTESLLLSFFDRVKQKFEEYEYDEAMESSYRSSLFKMFNKTLSDGFFPLIIVDAPNHKVIIQWIHTDCFIGS